MSINSKMHKVIDDLESELDDFEADAGHVLGIIEEAVVGAFRSAIAFFRHVFGESDTTQPGAGGGSQGAAHTNKD